MIKINRTQPPSKLTADEVQRLTELYKTDGKSVWNRKYIKDQLTAMTYGKCAYCEGPLITAGAYMEIEHFFPKSIYPDLVVAWDNLLPSCKRCNISKGSHDPGVEPIIDPSIDIPKDHLTVKRYRLSWKDEKGKSTINTLNLNDFEKVVTEKFNISEELMGKTEEIFNNMMNIQTDARPSELSRIRNSVKDLLQLVQPDKSYSGTLSAILLNDSDYLGLKSFLEQKDLWREDLQDLEDSAKDIALDIKA